MLRQVPDRRVRGLAARAGRRSAVRARATLIGPMSADARSPDPRTPPRPAPCSTACAPRGRATRCSSCPPRPTSTTTSASSRPSGFVFGAEVLTFSRLIARDRARAPALRARPLGPCRARPRRPGGDRRRAAAGAGRVGRARPASPTRPGALFAELQRSLVAPARFTAALRAWAAPAGRAAVRRRARRALLGATAAGWRSSGAPTGRATPGRRSTRCAPTPAAWGGGPCSSTASTTSRRRERDAVETLVRHAEADVCLALPVRARPRRLRGPRRRPSRSCGRSPPSVVHLPERSEHYAPTARPALHHLERRLFEPGADRAAAERRGPAARGRRRARGGRARRRRGARADAAGHRAAPDIAVLLRGDAAARPRCSPRCSPATGSRSPTTAASRSARTRLGAGVLAGRARRARPTARAADLLTWLRTPGRLPDPAAADRLEARVRRRELSSARARPRALGGAARRPPLTALDALAAAADEGAEALLAALEAEAQAIWTAPHRRRGEVLGRGGPGRRPRGRRPALRRRPSCASSPPPTRTLLGTPPTRRRSRREPRGARAAGARAARGAAGAEPGARRAARRPARDPRAALPRGLRLRAAGRRVPAPAGARAVPLRRRPPRRSRPPPACGCRCTRTCSTASARCSTPPSRAPRTCCSSPGARRTRRATRSRRPRSSTTSARCSTDGSGSSAARGCSPTSPGRRATRRRRTSCAAPTPRRAASPSRRRSARPRPRRVLGAARRAPHRARARAGGVRRLRRRAGWSSSCCGPDRIEPDPEPMRRGSLAHAVLERTLALLRERTGSARDHARAARRRARGAARRARRATLRAGRGRARRRALLRGLEADLERYLRTEAECGAGYEPDALEWSFGGARRRARAAPARRGGTVVTGRVDRVDAGPGRRRDRARLQGPHRRRRREVGGRRCSCRSRSTCSPCASCSGSSRSPGSTSRSPGRKLAARGLVRDDVARPLHAHRPRRRRGRSTRRWTPRASSPRATAAELRAGRLAPCPERCSSRGCRYPGICRAGRAEASCRHAAAPRAARSRPSSGRRSPTATARRCSPRAPAPARPR